MARSGVPTCSLKSRSNEILIEYYYCRIANPTLDSTQSRSREQQPRRLRRLQVEPKCHFEKSGSALQCSMMGSHLTILDVRPRAIASRIVKSFPVWSCNVQLAGGAKVGSAADVALVRAQHRRAHADTITPRLDSQAEHLAVARKRELPLHVVVTGETRREHILASGLDPLYRSTDEERGRRRHDVARIDRHFVAEAAPDIRGDDLDQFGRETRTPAMKGGLTARRLTLSKVLVCTLTSLVSEPRVADAVVVVSRQLEGSSVAISLTR